MSCDEVLLPCPREETLHALWSQCDLPKPMLPLQMPMPIHPVSTMKRMWSKLILLIALVIFSGCATSYQSTGFTGGYNETQLAPDVFRVIFRGNGFTPADKAQNFALLRAAELTVEHGFTCFAVINEQNFTRISSYTTPGKVQTTGYANTHHSGNLYLNPYGSGGTYSGTSKTYVNANSTHTPPQTHVFYKPESGILIKAFSIPPEGVFTFDAAFLQQSLKQKYKIK
jgi:hypothetical protein